jgi:hypothetical protein
VRVTRDERFRYEVLRHKARRRGFHYCGKCKDEVYKEDMWKRKEPDIDGYVTAHVCDTCCTTFEEALDYFKKRVNF